MNWWQILVNPAVVLLSAVAGGAITYFVTRQKYNYTMRGIYFAEKKKALEDLIKNITAIMQVLSRIGSLDIKQPGAEDYKNKLIDQYNNFISVSYEMIGRLGLYCDRNIIKEIVKFYDDIRDSLSNTKKLAIFSGEDNEGWDKFRNEFIYPILDSLREELKRTVGVKKV